MLVLQVGVMAFDSVPGSEGISVLMQADTGRVEEPSWFPVSEPSRYSLFIAGGVGIFAFTMRRRVLPSKKD